MGKYHTYAERLDSIARQSFLNYEKAVDAYEKAKRERADTPMKSGWGVTPEYQLKAKKAEVRYLEAEADFKEAKKAYKNIINEAAAIRAELLEEVTASFSVNPEDLDRNVVDLLNSGICSAEEIANLYDKAENITTKRYIAKFANEEIDRINKKVMDTTQRRAVSEILNNVISDGKVYTDPDNSEPVQIFDSVSRVLTRCINNPAMSRNWGELTEEALSEL